MTNQVDASEFSSDDQLRRWSKQAGSITTDTMGGGAECVLLFCILPWGSVPALSLIVQWVVPYATVCCWRTNQVDACECPLWRRIWVLKQPGPLCSPFSFVCVCVGVWCGVVPLAMLAVVGGNTHTCRRFRFAFFFFQQSPFYVILSCIAFSSQFQMMTNQVDASEWKFDDTFRPWRRRGLGVCSLTFSLCFSGMRVCVCARAKY